MEAVVQHEEDLKAGSEIDARIKRIRGNKKIYKPFPDVPAAQSWLAIFAQDRIRYPIMVVLGESSKGKTEWAKSLFKKPLELKIGSLQFFPETMRKFRRGVHDGIVLDDVRDLDFLISHQEKLQGKYDCPAEFASTAGGTCAFTRDLYQVPIVATINYTTKGFGLLESSDFLGKTCNRVLVNWPPPGFA